MNNKKRLIVFGTGEYYIKFKKMLEESFCIVAFVDNDVRKQNTYLDNILVIEPGDIKKYEYDKIFIASSYEIEIEKQLIDIGIEQQDIITSQTIMDNWIKCGELNFDVKYNKLSNDKINVMFCISELTSGGAQKVLIDLLNNLDYSKYSIDLVVIYKKGIYFNQINKNVNCIILLENNLEMLVGQNYIKKTQSTDLYKFFIKKEYNVEISFLEGESTKIISGSNNQSSKKLAWVHTNMQNNHWCEGIYSGLREEEECYRKFNFIICDSIDVRKSMINMFNINSENIKVIHTIIETNKIKELSFEENMKFDVFTFCAVGRLSKVKGIDRLIRVHKKLIEDNIEHNIIVIGEGEEERELKELVENLHVNDSFIFLGFQKNPYKYLKTSDVLILPSLEEGFSTVVCEALVLGKAIVATKCSGIIELLGNSQYGIVAENSEIGIYNSMKKVLLDSKLITYYEEMARVRMKELKKETIVKQIQDIMHP